MHTWLIFSGCIPTRSMSTLYIRDISVNKSKQSVWTRRGNIAAHYNAGAGVRVTRWCWAEWCVPAPCSCAELCRAAPLSACPSHLSAVAAVGSSVLNSDQGFYNYTIRSIHCLVESKLEERNVMDTYFAFWIVCRYFLGCVLSSLRTEGNYSSPFSALFALV